MSSELQAPEHQWQRPPHTAQPACNTALQLFVLRADVLIQCTPQTTLSWDCRYVEQNDIHSPQVTVGESLMFSAQLRLMDVNKRDLKAFVNEVSVCQPGAYKKWSDKLCKFCLEELLYLH